MSSLEANIDTIQVHYSRNGKWTTSPITDNCLLTFRNMHTVIKVARQTHHCSPLESLT